MENFLKEVLEDLKSLNLNASIEKGEYLEEDDYGREGETFHIIIDGEDKFKVVPGFYGGTCLLIAKDNHDKLYDDGCDHGMISDVVRNPYAEHDYENDGGSSRFEFSIGNSPDLAMAIVIFELESRFI